VQGGSANGSSDGVRAVGGQLPVRFCFPVASRLRSAIQFDKLRAEGRAYHGKLMMLSVVNVVPEEGPRLGLITSRRVGGAVQRNLVRRRLREVVRKDLPSVSRGWWMVIVARRAAASADFSELAREWRQLAARAGVMS